MKRLIQKRGESDEAFQRRQDREEIANARAIAGTKSTPSGARREYDYTLDEKEQAEREQKEREERRADKGEKND